MEPSLFALQALLHDLHVQHAEEAAAEAEAHRLGAFRLEAQRGVVQAQLVQRLAQVRVVLGIDREQAGEHARLHFLETGQRLGGRIAGQGQGVADRRAVHVLDRRGDPAHLARRQPAGNLALGREHAHRVDLVVAAGGHDQQLVAGLDLALHHAHQRDHAQVVVEPGVDDQRLQLVGVARDRRRDAVDDRLQHLFHVQAGLGRHRYRVGGIDADHRLDLGLGAVGIGGGQVDLVEHRHHFQAHLDRGVAVGHGLGFHALGRVHHQQRALAGGQRTADFIGEVDVAGGVDEVQVVGFAIARLVRQRHRLRLDGDATLALDRVVVQDLRFHFARGQAATDLDDAVGQGGLAMVDVGDDGEIADVPHRIGRHKVAAARRVVRITRHYRTPGGQPAQAAGPNGRSRPEAAPAYSLMKAGLSRRPGPRRRRCCRPPAPAASPRRPSCSRPVRG